MAAVARSGRGVEVVERVLRDVRHDPAERIRAVQRRRRAPQDLDLLHGVEIHHVASGRVERADAEGEETGRANAIDLDQDAVAFQAADIDALGAEAVGVVVDGDARLVPEQVLEALHQAPVDLLRVDHRDRRGNFLHVLLDSRGRHGDLGKGRRGTGRRQLRGRGEGDESAACGGEDAADEVSHVPGLPFLSVGGGAGWRARKAPWLAGRIPRRVGGSVWYYKRIIMRIIRITQCWIVAINHFPLSPLAGGGLG